MSFSMLAETGFFQQYWIIFLLLGLIIVMYVVSFLRRKKYSEQTQQMLGELKPGTKVKTYSGFYGIIVSIKETTDGKVILLEMGEGSKVSYTTVDANAVYGVDRKEDVVYDKEGNIIVQEDKKEIKASAEKEKAIKEFEGEAKKEQTPKAVSNVKKEQTPKATSNAKQDKPKTSSKKQTVSAKKESESVKE